MRRTLPALALSLLAALVLLMSRAEGAPPSITLIHEVNDARAGGLGLVVIGKGLNKVTAWTLRRSSDESDAGALTVLVVSKTEVFLGLPAALDLSSESNFRLGLALQTGSLTVDVILRGSGGGGSTAGGSGMTTAVFNASGSFEIPAGVTRITVEAWGGGGGGGASSQLSNSGGGGGGGGGYGRETFTVIPGEIHTVTVGAAGGTSSFGALLSASGGSTGGSANGNGGGGGGGGGTSTAAFNITGGSGTGASGGNGGSFPSVTAGGAGGAAGAGGPGGGGARASYTSGVGGNAGSAPGGGGGGAGGFGTASGGAGASGRVVITY